jgi:hypothetical protein
MNDEEPTEGRRVGVHPLIVVFGVIFGLWLFVTLIIPKSKNTSTHGPGASPNAEVPLPGIISSDVVPSFTVTGIVDGMNAITILVHPATTDSQVIALLQSFQKARRNQSLEELLPATTPEDTLGALAIADIYIFSEEQYADQESAKALSRGAHAPGEFYPSSIPYEIAMEKVRGHYSIDLHNKTNPEQASLGFGEDATGVYSKQYQRVF